MISAVLPIKIDMWGNDDLARASILLRSLQRFLRPGELEVLYLAHHEADDPGVVQKAIEPFSDLPIAVVSEALLVPELAGTSRRHWRKWFRKGRSKNWFRQQIIKLGVARRIETDFYLTLDADVLCTRPTALADLFIGDRAILDLDRRNEQPRWWRKSSMLVGVPLEPEGFGCSVTPVLLSREIVCKLLDHLDERSGGRGWVELLLSTKGWTEYSLYDVFAKMAGLIDTHHYLDPDPEHPQHRMRGPCLLHSLEGVPDPERVLREWTERAFSEQEPGFFSVVQSRTGLSAEQVWDAVSGRIALDGADRMDHASP